MAQSTLDLSMALKRFSTEEAGLIPLPGSGSTPVRFKSLAAIGGIDLSLARLAEGHLDALAILDERQPVLHVRFGLQRTMSGNVGVRVQR